MRKFKIGEIALTWPQNQVCRGEPTVEVEIVLFHLDTKTFANSMISGSGPIYSISVPSLPSPSSDSYWLIRESGLCKRKPPEDGIKRDATMDKMVSWDAFIDEDGQHIWRPEEVEA